MNSYPGDTNCNVPETKETLLAQQEQLIQGLRLAQMFPNGTQELELPEGYARCVTQRGIFHFAPDKVPAYKVFYLSMIEHENLLLGLGPYNKQDVAQRLLAGEELLVVTERTPEGVEVKAAVGSRTTLPLQLNAFEEGKLPSSVVRVERVDQVLNHRLSGNLNG